jgi:hypothetical protein
MAMVDRYKKSGGFVQLLQVLETCGPKKREQFMGIISQESPQWAEAINQKSLNYEKILSWPPEHLLEVVTVNMLSFATALKGLSPEQLAKFLSKFAHQDKGRIEKAMVDLSPGAPEIAASQMKVITDTRNLLVTGGLKAEKIDPALVIPHEFEATLQKGGASLSSAGGGGDSSGGSAAVNEIVAAALNHNANATSATTAAEVEKLQKKLTLLSKEFQTLKQENLILKDKLDKIKKIA